MISSVKSISSTSRFSNRAENYAKFRPGYPDELFTFIEAEMDLQSVDHIVDIGSGTGLFAEPLLKHGYNVVCLEPNEDMRKAGEERLKKYPSFKSIQSTAEHTGLEDNSVDLITIAQTFHWLDPVAARLECTRILKPHGHVLLAWNRQINQSEFGKKYTDLRNKYRIGEPGPVQIDPVVINDFFTPQKATSKTFANKQQLDFEGLKGQLLSKSYIPLPGHESYDPMITELIQLFVAYNESGLVTIDYETLLYWGKLN
ncbi:class I SAM-dependent methyltransferase [Paraflavitalea soli]|uniref:Class I SAM-dependent methyltransferase n=1 Tax=Paraflavitalea soli TaxID=2315862 RepID=A0A3B7MHP0_9BACT|nr:class I SAM-dependent methyltransferase [Paraflavitalea soli]AXY72823.1 class I SAM-dependent methyltransferase [Paraflavitalea soli]